MNGTDARWMTMALRLARRGIGNTGTNPSVGCVLVRDGRAIGRGRTGTSGRPHAERRALEDAHARFGADAVRGATAYVTLEPCAHTGKTPPCSDALIAAGIARVVAPLTDPDPRVSGRGFETLRAAGVTVDTGLMVAEAAQVLRGYLCRVQTGRPYVTLKLASTLDGRIATRTGESRWITGPDARAAVHRMRSASDAILLGVGSVLADDPLLDVRLPGLESRRPVRVVADSRLQTPLTGRLAQTVAEQPLVLLTSPDADPSRVSAFEELGAQVVALPMRQGGGLSLSAALETLGMLGLGTVLCEGGGRLAAGLLSEELVDEIVWFSAGTIIGSGGAPAISDFGVEALGDAPRFEQVREGRVGADMMSVWHPERDDRTL